MTSTLEGPVSIKGRTKDLGSRLRKSKRNNGKRTVLLKLCRGLQPNTSNKRIYDTFLVYIVPASSALFQKSYVSVGYLHRVK